MGSIKRFQYDAFISYRHEELDLCVAELLQKKLEKFVLPNSIVKTRREGQKTGIENIYRNAKALDKEDELSVQDLQALSMSEFLIVVCSPKTKESVRCRQEIQNFIKMHGYDHILAVLVEGEPKDAFPDEIMFREVQQLNPFGKGLTMRVPAEPFYADLRVKNKTAVSKKMSEEIIRLASPILSIPYDELVQKCHEEKMRKVAKMTSIGAVACLLFGIVSGTRAYQISKHNNELEAKSEAIQVQNNEMASQAEKMEEIYGKISVREAREYGETSIKLLEDGNRREALKYALMSVTEDEDGNALPKSEQGMKALFHSTYAYDTGVNASPCELREMQYEIVAQELSSSGQYLYVENSVGEIAIFDTMTGLEVATMNANEEKVLTRTEDVLATTSFLDDKTICYLANNKLIVYNFIDQQIVFQMECNNNEAKCFQGNPSVQSAIFVFDKQIYLYDYNEMAVKSLINLRDTSALTMDSFLGEVAISVEGDYAAVILERKSGSDSLAREIMLISVTSGEIMNTIEVETGHVLYDFAINDDRLLVFEKKAVEGESDRPFYSVSCYDLMSGEPVWEQRIQERMEISDCELFSSISEDGQMIALTENQSFYAFDALTGTVLYETDLGSSIISTGLALENGEVIVCVGNGSCYAVDVQKQKYRIVQGDFGADMKYMEMSNRHFYCVKKKSSSIMSIWTYHRGMKMQASGCQITSSSYQVDQSMENVFYLTDHSVEAKEIATDSMKWSLELTLTDLFYFADGKLMGYDYNDFYVIDAASGEILYVSKDNRSWKLIRVDAEDNSFLYSTKLNEIYAFDMDRCEAKQILAIDSAVNGSDYAAFSKDGRYAVLLCYRESRADVLLDGALHCTLDVNISRVQNMIIFPEDDYVLVQDLTGSFDVYSLEDGGLQYSYSGMFPSIQSIEAGKEGYPYVFQCSMNQTYFMSQNFYAVLHTTEQMHKVCNADYYYTKADDELMFVPRYDYEMLQADAECLLEDKGSNDFLLQE